MFAINLLPGAVSEILASAATTYTLTQADRYGLMAAMLSESLEEEERCAIDRLLRSIIKGRIQVVDDLSVEI